MRTRALLAALSRHGDDGDRMLRLHPDAARIAKASAKSGDLSALLWHELPRLERDAGLRPAKEPWAQRRTAAAYWHRRYQIALRSEWRWLLSHLPNLWRVLVDLPAAAGEELAVQLGVEAVAQMAAGLRAKQANALLAPLEAGHCRMIVSRVKELGKPALPGPIVERWRTNYEKAAHRRNGVKLLRWLSLSLLSNLLHARLSPRTRAKAARHCRSDLLAVLTVRPVSDLVEKEHLGAVETMVVDLMGRVRPGGVSPRA